MNTNYDRQGGLVHIFFHEVNELLSDSSPEQQARQWLARFDGNAEEAAARIDDLIAFMDACLSRVSLRIRQQALEEELFAKFEGTL